MRAFPPQRLPTGGAINSIGRSAAFAHPHGAYGTPVAHVAHAAHAAHAAHGARGAHVSHVPPKAEKGRGLSDLTRVLANAVCEREHNGERTWSADTLASKLRQYVMSGVRALNKCGPEMDRDEALKSYVENVGSALHAALSNREWFFEEDLGPLVYAGLFEVNPVPSWFRVSRMGEIKNLVYHFYDNDSHGNEFDNICWAAVENTLHGADKDQRKKAYNFFRKTFHKAAEDPENRSAEDFLSAWVEDVCWRVFQSQFCKITYQNFCDICKSVVHNNLVPKKFLAGETRVKKDTLIKVLKKKIKEVFAEGRKNFEREEREEADAREDRKKDLLGDYCAAARGSHQHERHEKREKKRARASADRSSDAAPSKRFDRKSERQWEKQEKQEQQECQDYLEPSVPDAVKVEQEEHAEMEHVGAGQPKQGMDGERIECVSVRTMGCQGYPGIQLYREKESGWIYCADCFAVLQKEDPSEQYEGIPI